MSFDQIHWILSGLLDWRFYAIIAVVYVVIFYIRVACSGLPPGPLPLPLLGNIPQLGTKVYLSLARIRSNHKDVFTVYLAHQPVVILTSHKAVREAFVVNGNKTSGRPKLPVSESLHQGRYGEHDDQ